MDRQRDDAPSDARLTPALAGLAVAVLVVVAPALLSATAGHSAMLGLAVVAVLLATLVGSGDAALLLTARLVGDGPAARRAGPPALAGRVTDPTHHPLRPRAPGTA